jgi:hypothetical protein
MSKKHPPKSAKICQKLLRGYQFSQSDTYSAENGDLYETLYKNFNWFQNHLAAIGFSLQRDDGVIFLEKADKALSKDEKQTIVILYLLADLWLESGKAYNDLLTMKIPWQTLDWFREGYGREYLIQVGIEKQDLTTIENLWSKLARKGLVEYDSQTSMLTLRKPAERLLNLARKIHLYMKAKEEESNEEIHESHSTSGSRE